MDSITQAVLGAAVGEAVVGKKIGNKAAVLGAVVGTIPDLDVLLTPFYSEFQKISLHRGYSHSIIFCLIGALLLAFLFQKWKTTKDIHFWRLYLFSFLGLFTHVLLDAFTSYGTQLFLPFSDYRVSFDSISIIDPFYTVPLLIGLVVALFKNKNSPQRRWWNYAGLAVSSAYLIFTLFNKQGIEKVFAENFKKQGIQTEKMLTVPVSFGNLLWYGVGKTNEGLYIGNYSVLDEDPEVSFEFFPTNENLLAGLDPKLIDRMKWFSQDFYTVAEKEGKIHFYNMQCDMQGVKTYGSYKAPTAFFFEIEPKSSGDYHLSSGMHHVGGDLKMKLNRIFGKNKNSKQ